MIETDAFKIMPENYFIDNTVLVNCNTDIRQITFENTNSLPIRRCKN